MRNAKLSLLMGVYGTILFAANALADDFPATTAIQHASLTQGLGQSSLPVLRRLPAASQAKVSLNLLSAVCATCPTVSRMESGKLLSTSEEFVLSVSADGNAAAFHNLTAITRSHSLAKPMAEKMSSAALEAAGRAYIASNLSSAIVLGQDEEMYPLLTDYRIDGLQEIKTGKVTRSVSASRIVFGRKWKGVPIVGHGSSVVITFANDGSVESFRYDWPQYEAVGSQSMAAPSVLLGRVQQAVSARTGASPAFAAHVPSKLEAAGPLGIDTNIKLQAMECGYYDAGADGGLTAVQPGCVYRALHEGANGMRAGYAGAVPGGVSFAFDAKWMETRIVK